MPTKKKKLEYVKIDDLKSYERNARTHNDEQIEQIIQSIKEFGFTNPVLIDENNVLIAGHGRTAAAKKMGLSEVPAIRLVGLTDAQKKGLRIADNQLALNAGWDDELLQMELSDLQNLDFNLDLLGFDMDEIDSILNSDFSFDPNADEDDESEKYEDGVAGSLKEKYLVCPFSVLKVSSWQERKRQWLSLGIKSELGRSDGFYKGLYDLAKKGGQKDDTAKKAGTSIFDPVLCEIMYSWFSKSGDKIIDPFAGGSVRGIVANKLNRDYTGLELRKEQVAANNENIKEICKKDFPKYIIGDSNKTLDSITDASFDMCLSCPPYADLEVYSEDPADLSNMPYEKFVEVYSSIIGKLYAKMKDDTFVVWVVGEVRNKDGNYYNFIGDTINAFLDAGFNYYNEIILETMLGTAALRAQRNFNAGRKIVKTHQNVLIFCKGDGKKAAGKLGTVEIKEIDDNSLDIA